MLDGKVCIVCGAGRGLGEATAKKMANYGATVVVNDLGVDLTGEEAGEQPAQETVDEITDGGGEATTSYGDITDLDFTRDLIQDTAEEFGSVDCIANYAGILRDNLLYRMSEDEWDAVIDVHLKGHFSLLHNAAIYWRDQSKEVGGFDTQRSFVCVSSGACAGTIGQPNYAAAKAGVLGLMRSAAKELDRYDVRVNAHWPLAFTRMVESMPEKHRERFDRETHDPMKAASPPVFLASDHAEDVTGCTIALHGDELGFVSNPVLQRGIIRGVKEIGGWEVENIVESWDRLTKGFETNKA